MTPSGALRRAVIELLEHPEPALPPPRAISPLALALDPRWAPSLLIVGGSLPARDEHDLRRRGCRFHSVSDLSAGLEAMTDFRWDAVLVAPTVESEADGLRFVRAFKCRPPALLPAALAAVATRYAAVPFLVLPLPGSTEFAVFWSALDWSLSDARTCPIAAVILRGTPIQ